MGVIDDYAALIAIREIVEAVQKGYYSEPQTAINEIEEILNEAGLDTK